MNYFNYYDIINEKNNDINKNNEKNNDINKNNEILFKNKKITICLIYFLLFLLTFSNTFIYLKELFILLKNFNIFHVLFHQKSYNDLNFLIFLNFFLSLSFFKKKFYFLNSILYFNIIFLFLFSLFKIYRIFYFLSISNFLHFIFHCFYLKNKKKIL
jgi:hypothetical protein